MGRADAEPQMDGQGPDAHLTYFDETAARAITDPEEFAADVERLWAAAGDGDLAMDDFHPR